MPHRSTAKYKAALHYKTVYDKCDAIDGLKDGLIDDPLKCKFDAMTDLPACSPAEEAAEGVGGVYSSTCFTLAQRQALKEIYAGPHNSHGKAWYPGQPLSAEYMATPSPIRLVKRFRQPLLTTAWLPACSRTSPWILLTARTLT